jgi:hypothetical protein
VVKLIIHDFISNTLDLLVVVSKPKIVRKHYCYSSTRLILAQHAKTKKCIDYDYNIGDRVLVIHDGIFRKAQSQHGKVPWTIRTVHTN